MTNEKPNNGEEINNGRRFFITKAAGAVAGAALGGVPTGAVPKLTDAGMKILEAAKFAPIASKYGVQNVLPKLFGNLLGNKHTAEKSAVLRKILLDPNQTTLTDINETRYFIQGFEEALRGLPKDLSITDLGSDTFLDAIKLTDPDVNINELREGTGKLVSTLKSLNLDPGAKVTDLIKEYNARRVEIAETFLKQIPDKIEDFWSHEFEELKGILPSHTGSEGLDKKARDIFREGFKKVRGYYPEESEKVHEQKNKTQREESDKKFKELQEKPFLEFEIESETRGHNDSPESQIFKIAQSHGYELSRVDIGRLLEEAGLLSVDDKILPVPNVVKTKRYIRVEAIHPLHKEFFSSFLKKEDPDEEAKIRIPIPKSRRDEFI